MITRVSYEPRTRPDYTFDDLQRAEALLIRNLDLAAKYNNHRRIRSIEGALERVSEAISARSRPVIFAA